MNASSLLALLLTLVSAVAAEPLPPKHPEAVVAIALSPDRTQAASLSRDGLIIIRDCKTGKEVRGFSSPRLAVSMRWLQQGKLITAGASGLAHIDPDSGKVLTLQPYNKRADTGAISPDGRFAAVANTHFTGHLFDIETGAALKPYPAPAESSFAMDISNDGKLLAIGGRGPDPDTLTFIETKGFTTVRQWPAALPAAFALCFSPDGKFLASAGDSEVLKVWKVDNGSLVRTLTLARPGALAVGFSPDGQSLAVCSGVPVKQLGPGHLTLTSGTPPSPVSSLQVWNLTSWKETWHSDTFSVWATCLLWLDAAHLCSGHADGTVRFWNTRAP
ncbi:MAG TPA: hypothetical protein VG796_13555 [Verrucomicrobiales bacterium]|nr:hypothetical protein [Verrucomicrobiales bacterium]